MALGTAMAACLIVVVCSLNAALSVEGPWRRVYDIEAGPGLFVALAAALILVQSIVADYFQPVDYGRCLPSLALLALILGAGIMFGRALLVCSDRSMNFSVRVSFWVLFFVLLMQVVKIQPLGGLREKSMFPFAETSHFALALTPVLLYRAVRAPDGAKPWWIAGSLAVALLIQSVALLAGCLLIAAACRRLLLVFGLALLLLLVGLPLGLEYFTSRLDFSGSVVNLSNLVYIEGWQLMFEALRNSHGWGIGFQQLGVHGTQVAVADTINAIAGGNDLNLMDGSFVFAKLAAELGLVGLLLALAYVVTSAHSLLALRRGGVGATMTFAHCLVVAYGVDMFVRGTGYFVQSTLLFISGVTILFLERGSNAARFGERRRDFAAGNYSVPVGLEAESSRGIKA
jgi:hypothetical protein